MKSKLLGIVFACLAFGNLAVAQETFEGSLQLYDGTILKGLITEYIKDYALKSYKVESHESYDNVVIVPVEDVYSVNGKKVAKKKTMIVEEPAAVVEAPKKEDVPMEIIPKSRSFWRTSIGFSVGNSNGLSCLYDKNSFGIQLDLGAQFGVITDFYETDGYMILGAKANFMYLRPILNRFRLAIGGGVKSGYEASWYDFGVGWNALIGVLGNLGSSLEYQVSFEPTFAMDWYMAGLDLIPVNFSLRWKIGR